MVGVINCEKKNEFLHFDLEIMCGVHCDVDNEFKSLIPRYTAVCSIIKCHARPAS